LWRKIARYLRSDFQKVWHVDKGSRPIRAYPKRGKRGERKWAYQITVLDSKGDVVASYLAPKRNIKAIRKLLKRAKEEAGFARTSFRETASLVLFGRLPGGAAARPPA